MQLLINNVLIPIAAGTKLPVVLRSPLFLTDEGNIPGSYIFNFSVPAGPEIRKVFGQAHRPQRHGRATIEMPYLITDGSLRFAGNCLVTQATKQNYEVACKIDNGDLAGKLADKTLKDLDWGDDIVITDFGCAAYKDLDTIVYEGESLLYIFFYSTIYIDLNDNLNNNGSIFTAKTDGEVDISLRFYLSNTDIENYEIRLYKNYSIHEAFSLVYGLNSINTHQTVVSGDVFYWAIYAERKSGLLRYTLTDIFVDFHGDNVFNNVIYLDQDASDYTIFPVHNKNLLANFPDDAFMLDNLSIKTIYSEYCQVVNYFKDGAFPLYLSGYVEDQFIHCANLFTPFVYMKSILSKIAEESGYTISNNPFDGYFKNMVLYNSFVENSYSGPATSILPIKSTFNLIDHVPEISQSDFLKYVSTLTGFMPVVDNNSRTIDFVDIRTKHIISETNLAVKFPGTLLDYQEVTVSSKYNGIKFELKKASTDSYLERIKELNSKLRYKGEVAHINNLPSTGNSINDMYLVTALNEYYVYQYNPETYSLTWYFFSKNFPLIYSEGSEPYLTYTSELCPVLTSRMEDTTLSAPSDRWWTIPQMEQPGIIEGFPDSLCSEYGLQVLYYNGMDSDSLGQLFPFGTCRFADFTMMRPWFITLSADKIIDHQYKYFLKWLAYDTKPVTLKAILTRAQFRKLRFDQVYQGEGFNFLVGEIRINMQSNGLSVADVDVYTV